MLGSFRPHRISNFRYQHVKDYRRTNNASNLPHGLQASSVDAAGTAGYVAVGEMLG